MNKLFSAYFLIFILISGTVYPIFSNTYAEEKNLPSWIKTNAGWWADGTIDDKTFFQAIEYLIQNGFIVIDPDKIPKLKQETATSVDDDNFFSEAKTGIEGWIKKISNSPYHIVVKSVLPVIPVVGPLLGNLYDEATKTNSPEEANKTILAVLKNMKEMNEEQLKKTVTKLDENKAAIENNSYKLDDLLTDTKQILIITTDTNERVKNLETKLNQALTLLNDIKVGKNTQASSDLKNQLNEITQLDSELENNHSLSISQLEALAKSYLLQENYDSAIKIYDQIIEQDSKNYNALLEKAWALYDLLEFSKSVKAFDEFLSYYPNDSEGWEGKGWSLLELDESHFQDARDSFNESFKLDNSNAYAIAGLGWISLEEGDCQLAESLFYDALSIDEYNPDAIDGLDSMEDYDC